MTDTSRPPLPDPSGLEDRLSPVDLPGDAPGEGAPLRWTVTIVAVATLFLFLFNATAIRAWASELAPSPWTEPAIAFADWWYETASGLGLTVPVETMHGWWEHARGGEAEAAPPPEDTPVRQPRPGERGPGTT
jgi:hypothetical protein